MYICSVIQKFTSLHEGRVIHQQSTEKLGQVNEWIKVFKTNKIRMIGTIPETKPDNKWGYNQMELENEDGTRIMLVTWKG